MKYGGARTAKTDMYLRIRSLIQNNQTNFQAEVVSRGARPAMFMEEDEERAARRERWITATQSAATAGSPADCEAQLQELALGVCFGVFCETLTGDPPANVDPMCVTIKAGADLSRLATTTKMYAMDKI